ncbi:YbhB/YbcL family Raf kinase inhibitor-like protein [Renibacterium salmoninarum]|nr:hypothetical protein [Renibacterium salmoninarum]
MSFIGKMFRPLRAGQKYSFWQRSAFNAPETLVLSSSEFDANAAHLLKHAGKGLGENISPQLSIENILPSSIGVLLLLEDSDVPLPRPIVHTVAIFNAELIVNGTVTLAAGALTENTLMPASFGRRGYEGPHPIAGHGPHHYEFSAYAFSADDAAAFRIKSLKALKSLPSGKILARGRLVGSFEQK